MKQITYQTIAIIIVLASACCCNCRSKQMTDANQPVAEEPQQDLFGMVFKNKVLQDSLNAFIQETRQCTYYDTLVYSVMINVVYSVMIQDCDISNEIIDKDTMIIFILDDGIKQSLDISNAKRSTVVGAIQRGNEILAVSYFDHKDGMDKVVNEDIFDMKLYFRYLYSYDATPYSWVASNEYRIDENGNLINRKKYRRKSIYYPYLKKENHIED